MSTGMSMNYTAVGQSTLDDGYNITNNSFVTNYSNDNTTTLSPLCELNTYCEPMDDYFDRIEDFIFPKPGEWVLIVIYTFTFIVGLVGNLLVCFAIWRNKSMRTITNMFIVNLSVADLAVIIICLPSALLIDVTQTWFLGATFCKIHIFLSSLSISISVLTLSSIAIERWYAICHPLRFHSTVSRARYIIITIWIVSTAVALPELIVSTVDPFRSDTVLLSKCSPSLWVAKAQVVYQVCLMVLMYLLPLCLMAFTYTSIALVLWNGNIPGVAAPRCRQQMLNDRQHTTTDNEEQIKSRKKAAKMLAAVVVLFGMCFFPIHLFNILTYTDNLHIIPNTPIFALITHWATFFNSCINPVIYNFMSDKFRKEFKVAMMLCVSCRRTSRAWERSDAYKVTFNSARNSSVRYTNQFVQSNASKTDHIELRMQKL